MLFLLDTADIKEIEHILDYYPLAGVTTNPTILCREKRDPWSILKDIVTILDTKMSLHVQTISLEAEGIVREADHLLNKLKRDIFIKIPVCPEGIKAIMLLERRGIKTTATAVFSPEQALIAAQAGASYIAPYVNRAANLGGSSQSFLQDIMKIYKSYAIGTKVLAASFKNLEQIHLASLAGVDAVTITGALLEQMLSHPLTGSSIKTFTDDWEKNFGKDRTFLNT